MESLAAVFCPWAWLSFPNCFFSSLPVDFTCAASGALQRRRQRCRRPQPPCNTHEPKRSRAHVRGWGSSQWPNTSAEGTHAAGYAGHHRCRAMVCNRAAGAAGGRGRRTCRGAPLPTLSPQTRAPLPRTATPAVAPPAEPVPARPHQRQLQRGGGQEGGEPVQWGSVGGSAGLAGAGVAACQLWSGRRAVQNPAETTACGAAATRARNLAHLRRPACRQLWLARPRPMPGPAGPPQSCLHHLLVPRQRRGRRSLRGPRQRRWLRWQPVPQSRRFLPPPPPRPHLQRGPWAPQQPRRAQLAWRAALQGGQGERQAFDGCSRTNTAGQLVLAPGCAGRTVPHTLQVAAGGARHGPAVPLPAGCAPAGAEEAAEPSCEAWSA